MTVHPNDFRLVTGIYIVGKTQQGYRWEQYLYINVYFKLFNSAYFIKVYITFLSPTFIFIIHILYLCI